MPYIVGSLTKTSLNMTGGVVQSGVTTTATTDETALVSLSAPKYQSVEFNVQVTQSSSFNSTIVKAMHDGTSAYVTEYGTLQAPSGIATFSADLSAGQLRLLAYPASAGLTVHPAGSGTPAARRGSAGVPRRSHLPAAAPSSACRVRRRKACRPPCDAGRAYSHADSSNAIRATSARPRDRRRRSLSPVPPVQETA